MVQTDRLEGMVGKEVTANIAGIGNFNFVGTIHRVKGILYKDLNTNPPYSYFYYIHADTGVAYSLDTQEKIDSVKLYIEPKKEEPKVDALPVFVEDGVPFYVKEVEMTREFIFSCVRDWEMQHVINYMVSKYSKEEITNLMKKLKMIE